MEKLSVAVLTNDLQYDLVELTPARVTAVKEASHAYKVFLDKMRELGAAVIHLQLIILPDDPRGIYEGRRLVARDTKGAEIISDFLERNDIVIEKNVIAHGGGMGLKPRRRSARLAT